MTSQDEKPMIPVRGGGATAPALMDPNSSSSRLIGGRAVGTVYRPPAGESEVEAVSRQRKERIENEAQRAPVFNPELEQYMAARGPTGISFEPPVELFARLGETYLATVTGPIEETVEWRIYAPPGNPGTSDLNDPDNALETHASKIVARGTTRTGIFKPMEEGRYLFVAVFRLKDSIYAERAMPKNLIEDFVAHTKRAVVVVKRKSSALGAGAIVGIVSAAVFVVAFIVLAAVGIIYATGGFSKTARDAALDSLKTGGVAGYNPYAFYT